MITKDNFRLMLERLGFEKLGDLYVKKFADFDCELKVDFAKEALNYPESKGFVVNEKQTCNFRANENFVVFECVHRLLAQGYSPKHIELEPKWQVGHGASGGRADILVKDNDGKSLLIIECKTAGNEFNNAWKTMQSKPTQLFSYVQQTRSAKFIALYASDFADNQIISDYYLINITDNAEHLEKNPTLKSYKDATTVEEIYQAWRDTYGKDYTTFGLFENNKPYEIGLTKPTAKNLKNITSKDIQGKYHEFATILRQHNVSGRENAFDKLVNLFLCKITDEKENGEELKFYWKGRAYDTPFDFQDRLQQLYKKGMYEFLGEDITYIDNQAIDAIFAHYDLQTIKESIKEVVKKQKFFTNNDFAFIDVHNEKLFYQNFEVLLKIARMIQDVSLSGSEENQFLGDMFEGFLDQGVKQSEGQFFTPLPIVKFIINSLPTIQNPHVIDYACGAGHFLNEYANINKNAQIVGIEKEYRLSKVTKVSSFMYGSNTQIIYADALAKNDKIKDGFYDALVANPPYSVKGFLETLSDEDRKSFELIDTIDEKSFSTNNAIECFFIERAKQLLKKDGVAGIIVPSSILNKGSKNNIYAATREILLKYFDIVAIAEFGSGTFGKTGTNTVALFLRRRCDDEDLARALKELADKLFECKQDADKDFKDKDMLQRYCEHIGVDAALYLGVLCGDMGERLFEIDMFKEYKSEFEKLTETKKRKGMKSYQALSAAEKADREKQELIKYINSIEKEKFYYFALVYKNSQDVVIVKAPSDNKEGKKFLGYEWSSAKGNEGIKYLSTGFASSEINEDEALDEEDKRILENLQGLKSINTPLYNPQNMDDESKINKIIKDNFDGKKTPIPKELEAYVSRARLVDMLDFSRVEFNKAISLTASKKVEIESKYPLVAIEAILEKIVGNTTKIQKEEILEAGKYPVITQEQDKLISGYTNSANPINDLPLVVFGDHSCTFKYIDFEFVRGADGTQLLKPNKQWNVKYFYYVLHIIEITNKEKYERHMKYLNTSKIPLPPLEIQEQIVKECEAVDDEVKKANETISKTKEEISVEIQSINGNMATLGSLCSVQSGGTPKREVSDYWNGDINWAKSEVCQNNYVYESQITEKITKLGLEKSSAKIFNENTVLIALVGATIGKVGFLTFKSSTNQNIAGLYPLDEKILLPKFLFYVAQWLYPEFMKLGEGKFAMASLSFIRSLKIPLPSLETQKEIVAKIERLESDIAKAKQVIDSSKGQKEAILKKRLNP